MSESLNRTLFLAVVLACDGDAERQAALIRALVADGADVLASDEDGATVLHRAVKAPEGDDETLPCLEVVRALLECGADVHAGDRDGVAPAGWALASGDSDPAAVERSLDVLTLLVEHGARLDVPCLGADGGSLVHDSRVAPPVHEFLLDHGAPTGLADGCGNTPLHAMVQSRRPRLVELLLAHGADTAMVNGFGQTPLGIALRLPQYSAEQRQARSEIVALLKAAGAPARVRYSATEGGPHPIDMAAIRTTAWAMRAEWVEEYEAAGIHDPLGNGWLTGFVEPDFDSYEHFVAQLGDDCDPDDLAMLPELCARALGDDTRATRTLIGDQRVITPFFHHGDLAVEGHLEVRAPFVVTGSLAVEGCLSDCGPDSVVAVRDDVTARAVYTDGEMSVGGDIRADVVYGSYPDGTLQAGTIRARLLIEDEHCTSAMVEADHHFDLDTFRGGYGHGVQDHLRGLLVDEVFGNDGDQGEGLLERKLLFARLREGRPVFRIRARTA